MFLHKLQSLVQRGTKIFIRHHTTNSDFVMKTSSCPNIEMFRLPNTSLCSPLWPFSIWQFNFMQMTTYNETYLSKKFLHSGIYPGCFTNVHFWTMIEFLNVLFHEKRSQNYCKIQVGVWTCCKLHNRFMAEPWLGFRW